SAQIFRTTFLDTHDSTSAKQQPAVIGAIANEIAAVLGTLRDTVYNAQTGQSMLDVTTVMISSEFGRTMSQADRSIDDTGTDHDPLANTVLLAGAGIRGGLVVGASDLDQLTPSGDFSAVSRVHQGLDRDLVKTMGKPFDFATERPLDIDIAEYDPSKYL